MTDGGKDELGDRHDRPSPPEDPFACSICGHPLSTTKRVAGDEHCDGCQREYGVQHVR